MEDDEEEEEEEEEEEDEDARSANGLVAEADAALMVARARQLGDEILGFLNQPGTTATRPTSTWIAVRSRMADLIEVVDQEVSNDTHLFTACFVVLTFEMSVMVLLFLPMC